MPYIKFADGRMIEVPPGVDPDKFAQSLLQSTSPLANMDREKRIAERTKQYESEVESPLEGMNPLAQWGAGVAHSVARPLRNALNMAGLKSDEEVKDRDRLDRWIKDAPISSPAGAGDVMGGIATNLALMSPIGKVAKALPLAAKTANLLSAAVGGGVTGALNASPDARGEEALIGAAFGTGAQFGLDKLGKLTSKGLAQLSPKFKQFRTAMGDSKLWAPLGQSVDEGTTWGTILKSLYKNILGVVPGSRGQILGQEDEIRNALVRKMARDSIPLPSIAAKITVDPVQQPLKYAAQVRQEINKILSPVKDLSFNTAGKLYQNTVNLGAMGLDGNIHLQVQDVLSKNLIAPYGGASLVKGSSVLSTMTKLKELRDTLGGSSGREGGQVQKVIDSLKAWGKARTAGTSAEPLWSQAMDTFDNMGDWSSFRRAARMAAKNPKGWQPKMFVDSLRGAFEVDPSATKRLGLLGNKVLSESAEKSSGAFATGLATGGLGSLALQGLAGISPAVSIPTAIGGSMALGARGTQRALVGDLKLQRALAAFLARNPEAIPTTARTATATFNQGE